MCSVFLGVTFMFQIDHPEVDPTHLGLINSFGVSCLVGSNSLVYGIRAFERGGFWLESIQFGK